MRILHSTSLPPGLTARRLSGVALALVVAHVAAMAVLIVDPLGWRNSGRLHYGHVSMFDLDQESGFGTWFSAFLLLGIGQLLLAQATVSGQLGDGLRRWWLFLAIGFHVLSVDEVAGMHEVANTLLKAGQTDTRWTSFAFVGIAIVGAAYLPFLSRLPRRTARLFVVAGVLFTGGAVGIEHVSPEDVNSLSYNLWTAVEEGLEMAGEIVMIYALLDHVRDSDRSLVRIDVVRTAA